MKSPVLSLFVVLFLIGPSFSEVTGPDRNPSRPKFLENEEVRIGVDLDSGGGIFYFSEKKKERNLLNHYDKGRFIQQSYYGDEDGSVWDGKPWTWNPVQGGGYRGEAAKVLEHRKTENQLYVKSISKNWATGKDLPDCIMEETITLEKEIAKIHFKFTYSGEKIQKPRHQELPAVFTDYDLSEMVYYSGESPWSNQPLTRKTPGWPNENAKATESWAAFVNQSDWGIGVYFPEKTELTCYRYEGDRKSGPMGSACSYFAPILTFAISKGLVYEYDIYLKIGTAAEIRDSFSEIWKKCTN